MRTIICLPRVTNRIGRWVALAATLLGLTMALAPATATAAHASPSPRPPRVVLALEPRSLAETGVVPNVLDQTRSNAVSAIQAAGFVAQVGQGSFDCGTPYVQVQSPDGGTTAPLGSTVHISVSRQPRPQDCP